MRRGRGDIGCGGSSELDGCSGRGSPSAKTEASGAPSCCARQCPRIASSLRRPNDVEGCGRRRGVMRSNENICRGIGWSGVSNDTGTLERETVQCPASSEQGQSAVAAHSAVFGLRGSRPG